MLNTSTSIEAILYSVIEGVSFGIKDGFEAVHAVSPKSDYTYLVGGGSKNDFWVNLITSSLNKTIIVGEDADLGPALGVARLAMLATNDYEKEDIIKSMPIKKEYNPSEKLSERLNKRYQIWKKIANINVSIANNLVD